MLFRVDTDEQVALAPSGNSHSAVNHERDTAEHSDFAYLKAGQQYTDSVCENVLRTLRRGIAPHAQRPPLAR